MSMFQGKCACFRAKTVEISGHLPLPQKQPIYRILRDEARCGAVFPGNETSVLMLRAECSLVTRKPARSSDLPTRRSCRAPPPPRKKSRRGSRCSDSRDRAHFVSRNQTTRLIGVGAGTTPCCAGERMVASSTQKRIFVSAHPSRSIP
jgi:hypothetical protein